MNTPSIAERFAQDTANHEMTVLRDDGLYRHVRFQRVTINEKTGKRERSSFYWFDLITWPGCLAIRGDMDSYLFARDDDMFAFFRMHHTNDGINPGYWAEKIQGPAKVKRYSEDLFRQHVTEIAEEHADDYPGLTDAVRRDILDAAEAGFEHDARELLSDFRFGDTYQGRCSKCDAAADGMTEAEGWSWESQHLAQTSGHRPRASLVEGFRFRDAWEWDLTDWSWQYLWCCHAIRWGIAQYDTARQLPTKKAA
jgi:hypothetical protein